MPLRNWVLLAAVLASVLGAASGAAAHGSTWKVTSTLDGKNVLPRRVAWAASTPGLPRSGLKSGGIGFLIDGKIVGFTDENGGRERRGNRRGAAQRREVSPYADGGTATHTSPWLTMMPSAATSPRSILSPIRFVSGSTRSTVPPVSRPLLSERRFPVTVRIDTPQEVLYYQNGGILPYVLRQLLRT